MDDLKDVFDSWDEGEDEDFKSLIRQLDQITKEIDYLTDLDFDGEPN